MCEKRRNFPADRLFFLMTRRCENISRNKKKVEPKAKS